MIQSDQPLAACHKLPKKECLKQCREAIIRTLGAGLPNPLPVESLMAPYDRFYLHKRQYIHQLSFLSFMERMETDKLINIEYIDDDVPSVVYMRHTKFSKGVLDLPACLLPVRNCYDRGCAHRSDCEVHFDRRTDLALQPD